MASFKLTYDAETGIVTCKFSDFVPDAEADEMVQEVKRVIPVARRRHGRLRMLMDNRDGMVFSTYATAAVVALKSVYESKDRIAALVPSGLRKFQAQRNASEQTRVFLSEEEAMDWLRAADEAPTG